MSYETAPSTIMLATNCAVCGRMLRDAISVERGIGPDCAEKHGYAEAQGEADWERFGALGLPGEWPIGDARACANKVVHRVACEQRGPTVPAYLMALDALGFSKLAKVTADRVACVVSVETEGASLVVRAPYSERFNDAFRARAIPGARFDWDRKARIVPAASKRALWDAIRSAFGPGTLVYGSRLVQIS